MKVIVKGTFRRDYLNKRKEIRIALDEKIIQLERAKNISQITGFSYHEFYKFHIKNKPVPPGPC